MPDEPTPDPNEPTPDPTPDPDPNPDDDAALEGLDDRTRALVERANSQAARFRREARTAQDELANLRQQQESDQERVVREAEERGFARAAPMIVEAEMAIAAAGRMRDPSVAARLLTAEQRDELLQIADVGERRARCDDLVADLLEAHAYMAVEPTVENGQGRTLVTQGGRSRRPESTPSDPDAWLRGVGRAG